MSNADLSRLSVVDLDAVRADLDRITGIRAMQLLPLVCASVLAVPSMDDLIDAAIDGYDWGPLNVHPLRLGPGLVCVSSEEVAELGIPLRSLRGWAGLEGQWQYVDRRCLKRYRRKAGRRAR